MYAITYFIDGDERLAAESSAESIFSVLGESASLLPLSASSWEETIGEIDKATVFFLATHGGVGEDGTLQKFLESSSRPFTHSSAYACSILTNKHATKLLYMELGIPTPSWVHKDRRHGNCSGPFIRKPLRGGSKNNISRVLAVKEKGPQWIYESEIQGHIEISVITLRLRNGNICLDPVIRGRSTQALGVLSQTSEIIPPAVLELCKKHSNILADYLDCYGITKTDFLLDDSQQVWAIETDAIPGMSSENASAIGALKAGISYNELIQTIATVRHDNG